MSLKPVSGKIESQELNDNFSYLQSLINNIEVSGPTEAFPTLSDLKSKYPSGKSGIFLVQESGSWYFWNGNDWVEGGTFQATPWEEFMTEQDEEWVI